MRLVSISPCELGDAFSGTGGACPFDFIDSFLKPISMVLLKWPERCWVKIALPRLSKHTVLLFRLLAIFVFLIHSLLTLEFLRCIKKLKHKNVVGGRHFIQKMIVIID